MVVLHHQTQLIELKKTQEGTPSDDLERHCVTVSTGKAEVYRSNCTKFAVENDAICVFRL